ncbi:thioredoxin domain-containing protein [Microbacterium sp. X-17]|uniref:DsbA family protein n=1 Tax=Microbacterium sp. X-17 TaxID=3144404 RepID=UPI0031F571F2
MAQVQRKVQPKRKVNWFAIWISVGVVVALVVIGGVVVFANNAANGPGTAPQASNINADTGAITVGTGPKTLDTYIDFQCPICNNFEQTYGSSIQGWVTDGTITLNIHPISILNRQSNGTNYSTRAASAMYCVAAADPNAVLPFLQAMYAQQPQEGSNGLTDDQIVSIATGAGVTNATDCIKAGTYKTYVDAQTKKTPIQPGQSSIATPTIVVNGTTLSNQTDLTGKPADLLAKLQS